MRYCLLMHYQEASEIGLTEEDMGPRWPHSRPMPTTCRPRAS